MLVPMIATIVPGPVTVAAGTETWASTFATATAVPRETGPRGGPLGQSTGALADEADVTRHLVVDHGSNRGSRAAKYASGGNPSPLDQIAL